MSRRIPADVVDDQGNSLYVSERKIYPRDVSGTLNRLRVAAVFWLLGMFYLFPWLRWDGRQAVLFDLPARKFYVFGLTFWPQDFLFLALLLIIAAMALFFFTTLAGRLWCGYACPQTVWTEVFLWMERWTEGDRNARMKLDAAPWSAHKLLRKGSKHLVWALFALWTGFTFVGFFTPITDLAARLFDLSWGGWETFWVLFYALATWGNAGFLREQVCKYMCPYARFQSAMFDRNTLIIAYDPMRGEPRGPRKRGLGSVLDRARGLLDKQTAYDYVFRANRHPTAADNRLQAHGTITFDAGAGAAIEPLPKFSTEELGDCVDCTICVQVCPTGIDIRNGLQYECIACGACIDACDEVMQKVGYPKGLIRYSTQNAIDGKPSRVLRPRIFVYGALLLALCALWVWGVSARSELIVEVLRDRNALYRELADGGVENSYTLKIVNKSDHAQDYHIALETSAPGIALRDNEANVSVAAGQVLSAPVVLVAPAGTDGRHEVRFVVEGGGAREEIDSSFFGPM
ncbi:cytochrome c oxidase accessory protein CcoG [Pseudoxanthomonas kalamensis DSM 18571]|uniref:4Fe-4S dicluster domain-containing protein n=1 Tax=Pseudoxanthomonas kalamensis TaxID=289483 RepID=UPI001391470C|nr:4Fe-4S dicluster domain-containing protein [Pseudoxanthomonas kalamensis]KAF1709258.1 cytochrome c oxidase accessory protein CcoG [Pseudoxanthomonas kalamensis DSM 18571]